MENKKLLKKIIGFILFFIMIYLFIILGTKNYKQEISDNVKFSKEYNNVSENNIYKYLDAKETYNMIKNGEGIILMGFSSNEWCKYYAEVLNRASINNNIDEIYYYDFKSDRNIDDINYNNIVKKLTYYLNLSDDNKKDLFAPTIIIIRNGKTIYFNDEVSNLKGNISAYNYFTDYKINELYNNLDVAIKEYKGVNNYHE